MLDQIEKVSPDPSTLTANQKISIQEKVSFFLIFTGNIPIHGAIGSFLLIFYTDIVGLNPATVATLFLITRIFDGINDPIVGYIIDHLPHTRWGRFRPLIVVGSVLAALNFAIVWLGPSLATEGKLAIAYVSYLLLSITYALMDIPKNSLLPVMTTDPRERNSLATIASLAGAVGLVVVPVIVLTVVGFFTDPQQGWYVTIFGIAIFVILLSCLGASGVRERVQPETKASYSLSEIVRIFAQTPPIWIRYGLGLLVVACLTLRNTVLVFYTAYNLNNVNLFIPVTVALLCGVIVGGLVGPRLTNYIEKRTAVVGFLLLLLFATVSSYFTPSEPVWIFLVETALVGMGISGALAIAVTVDAEILDYIEWRWHYRVEGILASINSSVSKIGIALGGAISGYVLAFTGYVAGAGSQPSTALQGILITNTLIPAMFSLLAIFLFLAYPMSHARFAQIRRELSERKRLNTT